MNWFRRGILFFIFVLLSDFIVFSDRGDEIMFKDPLTKLKKFCLSIAGCNSRYQPFGSARVWMFYPTVASGQDAEKTPNVSILLKVSTFNVNDKKAMYCQGDYLTEKLEWYSPNNTVVQGRSSINNRIFVERQRNDSLEHNLTAVIIQSAQIQDSGNWTCRSGELSESINIVIGDKMVFSSDNESIEAEEGKLVRLHCETRGYPEPKVQWYRHNDLLRDDKKYSIRKVGNDTQLEIRNLNHQDSGLYTCQVLQQELAHFTTKYTWLSVQHKPLIMDSTTQEVSYKTMRTEEVFAILDESKNITCSVLANPLPTYTWMRRTKKTFDELIPPEPDMVFSAEDGSYSVLKLRIYNTSYLGQYVCSANNTKGKVSIVYHVSVGNKPDPPDFVSVVNASVDSITFNVSCSTCFIAPKDEPFAPDPRNLSLLGFSFAFAPVVEEYAEADWDGATELTVDIVDPDDTLFIVGPLPNNTKKFHARVRSRNAAGFSSWIVVPEKVSTTDLAVSLMASIFLVTLLPLLLLF